MQVRESIEGNLKKIDLYFEEKSKNTFQMFCMLIVLVVFGLAYLLYYEDMYAESEEVYNSYERSVNDLDSKKGEYEGYFGDLSMESSFVDGFVNTKIMGISNQITNVKKQREVVENTRNFFRKKLEELSYLLFSNKKGAEFAKSLTSLANDYNLYINILNYNDFYHENSNVRRVSPVLQIELELFGEFKDIIRYVNSIEKSQMVVDVNELNFYKFEEVITRDYNQINNSYNANRNNMGIVDEPYKLNNRQVNAKIKISIWGVN